MRGSLEGSRGDRALVYDDTITELPIHHLGGLHFRSVLNQETECGLADTCITCGARNFDQGEWLPVLSRAEISRGATALPPDFHLPTMWGSMRFATRPRALGSGR